jgi:uncharacterized protein YkwD
MPLLKLLMWVVCALFLVGLVAQGSSYVLSHIDIPTQRTLSPQSSTSPASNTQTSAPVSPSAPASTVASNSASTATQASIAPTVSKPAPLIKNSNVTPSDPHTLTIEGIIAETNKQRAAQGLPALSNNPRLANAAELKVEDMFRLQYFEHVSPTGATIETLSDRVGYAYVNIGENLALGAFDGDAGVVDAWMNSPGHRANILNDKYQEIGVAVMKGTYQGRTVWMAVQEFGRPLSACPQIDQSLKLTIDQNEATVDNLKIQLAALENELSTMSRSDRDAYNAKVDEYNTLVNTANNLIATIKSQVSQYNNQVRVFNVCVTGVVQ